MTIVNLISLANQQKITFGENGVDLTMYNDDKVNPAIIISSDACICSNSPWKLSNCSFKNKIVHIDEIYALCISLTHNEILHKQRQIFNTLYRIVTACRKLIVSDAHIHNKVMQLLNPRLNDSTKTYVHYCNDYTTMRINSTRRLRRRCVLERAYPLPVIVNLLSQSGMLNYTPVHLLMFN